jgi:hypothetical protein
MAFCSIQTTTQTPRQSATVFRSRAQALDAAQRDLDGLSQGCEHINSALRAAKAAGAEMLADTERISRDLAVSQTRSRLVEHFLEQYQLSPQEVSALQVTHSPPVRPACSWISRWLMHIMSATPAWSMHDWSKGD